MAIKLVRKKRKNADGSYDIVHYETQAKIVWFEDGESFQEKYDSGELRGQPGDPGSTPQKGTDYWTLADKAEMVDDVLAALPTWTGGSY